jgi:glyoxylase-like metal-dependent hydrolase (beta-lactamase superfamily II)
MDVIDLTQPLDESTEIYEEPEKGYSDPKTQFSTHVDIGVEFEGKHTVPYRVSKIEMGVHTGTHMDAPAHFHRGAATIDALAPGDLAGRAVVIDIQDEEGAVERSAFAAYRQRATVPGTIPLIVTGSGSWSGSEAVEEMIEWGRPLIVFAGHVDEVGGYDYPNHAALLGSGIHIVTGVVEEQAARVRDGDLLVVAPLPLQGLEGAPCRVLALTIPWFEVEAVETGVYSIVEPGHAEYVRSYLVVGETHAVLIDTGTGFLDIRPQIERLTDLPVKVILTHTHWDHIGNAHRFSEVACFDNSKERERLETGISTEDLKGDLRLKNFGRPWPSSEDRQAFKIPGVENPTLLHDGDEIDLGQRSLRVIHTPGHSPGSISLWDETNGLLFVGDTLYYGALYGYDDEFSLADYQETARKLGNMGDRVRRVLPGHNELAWEGAPMSGEDLKRMAKFFRAVKAGKKDVQVIHKAGGDRFSVEYVPTRAERDTQ